MVDEPPLLSDVPMNSPDAAIKVMADTLKNYDREVVAVVNLRTDLKPINVNFVSMGALDQCFLHPREAIKSMVLSNAYGVMLVHNHPSGKMNPSKEDVMITDRMAQLCQLLDIKLLDHIIVGPGREYYSFFEKNAMPLDGLKLETNIDQIHLPGFMAAEKEEYHTFHDLKDVTDRLEQGVKDVFQSERYQAFLNTMARFPRYSVNNNLLIMLQKPDAQICQSFTGWKKMGRYVKKGEKGISILAPAPYKVWKEKEKVDDSGKTILDAAGKPVKEKEQVTIQSFKIVKTFDISQTEGKELPSLGISELIGSVEGYSKFLNALQSISPVPIAFEEIGSGAKGYYSQMDKRIAVQKNMGEVQTLKTIVHEMAHQKLHDKDAYENTDEMTRNRKEVEAESVAYVVCQHYGIDTSDYSFSYVASWSEGKETPELKASLDRIRQAASDFIVQIDEKVAALSEERDDASEEKNRPSVIGQLRKEQMKSLATEPLAAGNHTDRQRQEVL